MSVLDVNEVACLPDAMPDPMRRSFELWRSWAGETAYPRWADVDLVQLPSRAIPMTSVVDVIDGGADFVYRFYGTGMVGIYTVDETGKRLSETLGPSFIDATAQQLGAVLESGAPRLFRVQINRPSGAVAAKLNLRLPIGSAPAGPVDKIMTVAAVELPGRLADEVGAVYVGDKSGR